MEPNYAINASMAAAASSNAMSACTHACMLVETINNHFVSCALVMRARSAQARKHALCPGAVF